jgi:hypothetical protein
MRTLVLTSLLVTLMAGLAEAQAAPAQAPQTPQRVIAPKKPKAADPAAAPAAAPAPEAPAAPAVAPAPAAAPAPAPAQAEPPVAAPLPAPEGAPLEPAPEYQLAPPGAEPPPAYGYGYPPPSYYDPHYAARRHVLYSELNQVDGRLREIRSERPSVVGPIAMMASGYGVALFSSVIALGSFVAAEAIEHDDFDDWDDVDDADINGDDEIDADDERAARNTARVFTGFAALGLGVGIGGTVLFAKRMQERKVHKPEVHDLKMRRKEIRRELKYGANVTPAQAQVTVGGRF